MKILFLIPTLFMFSVLSGSYQTQKNDDQKKVPNNFDKWIKATINIEGVASNFNKEMLLHDYIRAHKNEIKSRKLNLDSLQREKRKSIDNRPKYTGTAIFLKYNDKLFLITARHVIADTTGWDSSYVFPFINLIENPTTDSNIISGKTYDSTGSIWIRGDNVENISLNNMSTGLTEERPYLLSSVDDDIAVICLNYAYDGESFAKTLYKRGYLPIGISDIDTVCNLENGQQISIIGFPQESIWRRKETSLHKWIWESNLMTLPFISNGDIMNFKKTSHFFEGGIFTYKGDSGGPIISNNKLIGIVSGFNYATMKMNVPKLNEYYLYESRFIKTLVILPLLRKLESAPRVWR